MQRVGQSLNRGRIVRSLFQRLAGIVDLLISFGAHLPNGAPVGCQQDGMRLDQRLVTRCEDLAGGLQQRLCGAFNRIVGFDHGHAMGVKQIVQAVPYARQRGRGPAGAMPERLQGLIDFHDIDGIVRVHQGKEQFARRAAASRVTCNEIGP